MRLFSEAIWLLATAAMAGLPSKHFDKDKKNDMNDIYEAPKSDVSSAENNSENNSGMKPNTFPEGVKGWSWGGFLLNWIWAIFNKSYIGLLALLPYVGVFFVVYLGLKGRQLAWKNKHWESVEHFNRA